METTFGPGSGIPEERGRGKKRTGTSKYDFVKVKVWLGEGESKDHYYVLSRFLISRMLTLSKIPYIKAVKIALEVKKYLVDNDMLDVKQRDFEEILFNLIKSKGFDDQYIDCYKMVTEFFQQRRPLIIIICGTAWTGKSTLAQQLASRINVPNVMQTDVIYELLRGQKKEAPLDPVSLCVRTDLRNDQLIQEFRRECRIVRKGMEGDLVKTLSDGKPLIIEGMHLDPGLYIQDFGRSGIIMLPVRPRQPSPRLSPGAGGPGQPARRSGSSRYYTTTPGSASSTVHGFQGQQLRRSASSPGRSNQLTAPTLRGQQQHTQEQQQRQGQQQKQQGQVQQQQHFGDLNQQEQQQTIVQASWSSREVHPSSGSPMLHGWGGEPEEGGCGPTGWSAGDTSRTLSSGSSREQEAGMEAGVQAAAGRGAGGVGGGGRGLGGVRSRRRWPPDGHRGKGGPNGLYPIPEVNQASLVAALPQQQQQEVQDPILQHSQCEPAQDDGCDQHQQQQQEEGEAGAAQVRGKGPRSGPSGGAGGRERGDKAERTSSQDGPKLQQLLEQDQQLLLQRASSRPPCVGYELSMPTIASPDTVCGRAAEAEALFRQEEQAAEQQQQQERQPGVRAEEGVVGGLDPGGRLGGSGLKSDCGSWGEAGSLSPCISREHSTTEVVSREASFASSEDGSPHTSRTGASESLLGASSAAAAAVLVTEAQYEAAPTGLAEGSGGGDLGRRSSSPGAGGRVDTTASQEVAAAGKSSGWQGAVAAQQAGELGREDVNSSYVDACAAAPPAEPEGRGGGRVRHLEDTSSRSGRRSSSVDGRGNSSDELQGLGAVGLERAGQAWPPLPSAQDVQASGAAYLSSEQQPQQEQQRQHPGHLSAEALQAHVCLDTEKAPNCDEQLEQKQLWPSTDPLKEHKQHCQVEGGSSAPEPEARSGIAAQASHACASVSGEQASSSSRRSLLPSNTSLPQHQQPCGEPVSGFADDVLRPSSSCPAIASSDSSVGSRSSREAERCSSRRPHSAPESSSSPVASGDTSCKAGSSSSSSSSGKGPGPQDSKPVSMDGSSVQRKSSVHTSPSGRSLKPLFVPIVVYMDEVDHTMIAEEALSHQLASSGSGGTASGGGVVSEVCAGAGNAMASSSGSAATHMAAAGCGGGAAGGSLDTEYVREAIRKARVLQDYLCVYEGQGLPVVRVSYGNFGEALDKLHEYILQCIKVAMHV